MRGDGRGRVFLGNVRFRGIGRAHPRNRREGPEGLWDKPATASNPQSAVTVNELKLGKPYKATAQEVQVEGIPKDATVTPVVVDFTVRTYYASETQAVRRVREAMVYKDKMDDWSIMTGSAKGQDTTTKEAAK